MADAKKRIVVMGGGTGTFALLRGLKQYADTLDISAIITMTDSGGSTGRLRDQFGMLPVGDVRMAMLALADEEKIDNQSLRDLFLYRFTNGGEGLEGHNFGNLFLTALTDVVGGEREAIAIASRLFGLKGRVLPVTYDDVELVATYDDGATLTGEAAIDAPPVDRHHAKIIELTAKPSGTISPDVKTALREADLIVLGPGDLYTSLLAILVVGGMRECMQASRARFAYITNLMSKPGQTTGYDTLAYLTEVERYAGRAPDYVLINDAPFSDAMREAYASSDAHAVTDAGAPHGPTEVIRGDFLAGEVAMPRAGDALSRSLVRHDAEKLAKAVVVIL